MMAEEKRSSFPDIPKEKFTFIRQDEKILDEKLKTKPVGYWGDAWIRFSKNKSAVIAFVLILLLALFSVIVPFFSGFRVDFRDGYYAAMPPKCSLLSGTGFWDGSRVERQSEDGCQYLNAIGRETGRSAITAVRGTFTDEETGSAYYDLRIDSYVSVGFVFLNLNEQQYRDIMAYQNQTGIQVLYPLQATHVNNYGIANNGANFWYRLKDESFGTAGGAVLDENGNYIPNYLTSENPSKAGYTSLRIAGDDGQNGQWYTYAVKNQTGYKVRADYYQYFIYQNGMKPSFLFGTNVYGQDMFTCLAAGGRLSFALAIVVASLSFIIGAVYGAVEGYYGGTADIIMERISEILSEVPFIVVATLFQLHLSDKVGVLPSLLFAFVLTGWIGIASRVRMQFYRFKGQEYVLAARTLGAGDFRLIFRHIFPNSLGTIVTQAVLTIPGVIFEESMLSYLHIINLETSSLTSIGTLLSGGQALLGTYPHIIMFPAIFIAILEVSFNLFGNGLRDALNPALRGADD